MRNFIALFAILLLVSCTTTRGFVNVDNSQHQAGSIDWTLKLVSDNDSPYKLYKINTDRYALINGYFGYVNTALIVSELEGAFLFSNEERLEIINKIESVISAYESSQNDANGKLIDYVIFTPDAFAPRTSSTVIGSSVYTKTSPTTRIDFRLQYTHAQSARGLPGNMSSDIRIEIASYDQAISIIDLKGLLKDLKKG